MKEVDVNEIFKSLKKGSRKGIEESNLLVELIEKIEH